MLIMIFQQPLIVPPTDQTVETAYGRMSVDSHPGI
jgi:hypothetical protein